MLETKGVPLNFLRYGLSRKKEFLKDVSNAYDGIVLPANILLYQYKSTPSVILLTKKAFFIDPMSYLFGQEFEHFKRRAKKTNNYLYKPSFERLMEGHGLKVEHYFNLDYHALLYQLIKSQEEFKNFVDSCHNFQWNNVFSQLNDSKDLLSEEEQKELLTNIYRPQFVIPPYFLYEADPNSDTNLLNMKILEYCSNIENNEYSFFPMIFLSRKDLNAVFIETIIPKIKSFNFPGYCIWISDFDERYINIEEAKAFLRIVKKLSEGDKQVVDIYGGYFSLISSKVGLSCVCHGLTFGESKGIDDSAKVKSGPAPIRYYIENLHRLFIVEDAVRILRARKDLICDCQVCVRFVRGDTENVAYFEAEEELTEMHFLLNRYAEKNFVALSSTQDVIDNLEFSAIINRNIETITKPYKINNEKGARAILTHEYLEIWKEALEIINQSN